MRQPLAAFLPTTVQDVAASFARHALYKAMFAGTLTFFGLVGSFGHSFILA